MFKFVELKKSGKLSGFLYYSILGYIASLFLSNSPVVTNIFMLIIFMMAWLNVSYTSYIEHFKKNKVNLGLILFFVLQFVSVLFSDDKLGGFEILRIRLPLFLLPIAFCLIDFERITWHKILLFYIVATAIASLTGFFYGCYMAFKEHSSVYLYNDNISQLLIDKQAAYFGIYVNIAIFSIIYLLSFKNEQGKNLNGILYFSLLWLIFINYMLASTMSSISLVLILSLIILFQVIRRKKFLEGFILIFGISIGIFLLNKTFPKPLVRFQRLTLTSYRFDNTNPQNHFDAAYNADEWSNTGTRLALWQCGKEIWLNHIITGTGLGDIRNALRDKYNEKHFWFALNSHRNLHCQYLDILVSMGIAGLLFFLLTYIIYPFKTFITGKQSLALCVFGCFALCLLTENVFDRYQGEILVAFVLPLSAKFFDEKEPPIDYRKDTC